MTIYNGDGDGIIETDYCYGFPEESCLAWQHLILAGLLSGDPNEIHRVSAVGGTFNSIATRGNGGRFVNKLQTVSTPSSIA